MSQINLVSPIELHKVVKSQHLAIMTTDVIQSIQRPISTYLPTQYEQRYAYPLVVLFHAEECSNESAISYAPRISDRNHIAISMRGPKLLNSNGNASWDGQTVDELEEDVVRAVEHTRRQFNIHSERVYFVGLGDGGRAAYRVAFRMANRIAGLAVLNSPYPTAEAGKPLFQMRQMRKLRLLIGHGVNNLSCPYAQAERAFRLTYTAGCNVNLAQYATNKNITDDMLRDVNRWIVGNLNNETDQLILANSTIPRTV